MKYSIAIAAAVLSASSVSAQSPDLGSLLASCAAPQFEKLGLTGVSGDPCESKAGSPEYYTCSCTTGQAFSVDYLCENRGSCTASDIPGLTTTLVNFCKSVGIDVTPPSDPCGLKAAAASSAAAAAPASSAAPMSSAAAMASAAPMSSAAAMVSAAPMSSAMAMPSAMDMSSAMAMPSAMASVESSCSAFTVTSVITMAPGVAMTPAAMTPAAGTPASSPMSTPQVYQGAGVKNVAGGLAGVAGFVAFFL